MSSGFTRPEVWKNVLGKDTMLFWFSSRELCLFTMLRLINDPVYRWNFYLGITVYLIQFNLANTHQLINPTAVWPVKFNSRDLRKVLQHLFTSSSSHKMVKWKWSDENRIDEMKSSAPVWLEIRQNSNIKLTHEIAEVSHVDGTTYNYLNKGKSLGGFTSHTGDTHLEVQVF